MYPDLVLIRKGLSVVFLTISDVILKVCAAVLLITRVVSGKEEVFMSAVHVFSISAGCSHGFVVQGFTEERRRARAYKMYFEFSKEHPKHSSCKTGDTYRTQSKLIQYPASLALV